MNQIVDARFLAPEVKLFRVHAPKIARKRRAGQFVILRVSAEGERIPLTIADADPDAGSVTLVVQGVGRTTHLLNRLEAGDSIHDVAGPLGRPSDIEHFGTSVVVGGGVGAAIAYPTAKALAEAGNTVITVLGARTRDLLILEDELRAVSTALYPATDDGSYGHHGLVTDVLAGLVDPDAGPEHGPVHHVLAIGPVPMMRAVAEVTRPRGIPTVVSLNPIMVDGTGMCGGCRVSVGGVTRFACVDGPEFDAHLVDFDLLARRNRAYASWERDRDRELLCALGGGEPDDA